MSKKRSQGEGWALVSSDSAKRSAPGSVPPDEQRARISIENRNRGKTVTLIANLQISDAELKALAKDLKVACGTGGTTRTNTIELQGDHRDKVRSWLQKNAWGIR